jgi:N-acylneuraminate cytidylyltransferase
MINNFDRTLFLITARGGSKGLPGKNIKKLNGTPLINYTIDVARQLVRDHQICLSTDSDEIINVAKDFKLEVPFKRPNYLATDTAGTYEVIIHALEFYKLIDINFDSIVLLQPTSPLRTVDDINNAFSLFNNSIDMVASVNKCKSNPFYNLFQEDDDGYIYKSQKEIFIRRQDAPNYFEYNGAIYIINVKSLENSDLDEFKKVKKYLMNPLNSVDIDTTEDWEWAEYLIKQRNSLPRHS